MNMRSQCSTIWQSISAFLIVVVALPVSVFAAGPSTLAYEGFLRNSAGVAQNGTAPITVRIYNAQTAGNLMFEEVHPSISIDDGYFSLQIGSIGDVNGGTAVSQFSELLFDTEYYITTEIGSPFNTGEMTISGGNRAPISLQPYSYAARAFTSRTSTPSGTINTGQVYYDSTAEVVYVYNGTTWIALNGSGSVTSTDIVDASITGADMALNTVGLTNIAQIAANTLVGNATGATGDATAITLGTGLEFLSGQIQIASSASLDWSGAYSFANTGGVSLKPFGILSGETTSLRFGELAANGTNYVGFKSPDSVGADTVWTLPDTDGTTGQVLSTDGSGVLSWANASGTPSVPDNSIGAYDLQEGSNNYVNITTTDSAENITFGNTTTNPSYTFAGTGSITSAGRLLLPNGSAAFPGLAFSADSDNGIYSTGTDVIGISQAGASRILIASGSGVPQIGINANATESLPGLYFGTTAADLNSGFYRIAADELGYSADGTEALRITSGGLLGLGDITPSVRLDINGDSQLRAQGDMRFADADSSNYVGFQAPGVVSSNLVWTLPSVDGASGQVLSSNGSGVLSWLSPATVAGSAGALQFSDGSALASDNTNLYWDDTNNRLGIGTNAPSTRLEITGGDIYYTDNGSDPTMRIGDATTAGNYGYIRWDSSSDVTVIGTQQGGNTLKVTEGNRVGINMTPSLSERFAVLSNTGDTNVHWVQRSENTGAGLGYTTFRRGDGTEVGYISCNVGALTCALTSASDRRLKSDIQEVEGGALTKVVGLGVYNYRITSDPDKLIQNGFVAQELREVYPEAVVPGDANETFDPVSGKMWGVDYGRITPLLVAAIQEQQLLLNNDTRQLLNSAELIDPILVESPRNVRSYISALLDTGRELYNDLVVGRITALRGYFGAVDSDTITSRELTTERLCVGTGSDRMCLNKQQIEQLITGLPALSSNTPAVESVGLVEAIPTTVEQVAEPVGEVTSVENPTSTEPVESTGTESANVPVEVESTPVEESQAVEESSQSAPAAADNVEVSSQ